MVETRKYLYIWNTMKINVLDLKGNKLEAIELSVKTGGSIDGALRYLRVFLSNQRQGTSAVKTRAMVSGGGKKPWKQKGTGRARAGSTRSPLWVGGGRAHGPMPKSWRLSIPRSLKASTFNFALNTLIENGSVSFVDFSSLDKVSTKNAFQFVKDASFENEKLVLVHNNNDIVIKSFRNLKNIEIVDVKTVNSFNLVSASKVIIDKEAAELLKEKLK